MSLLLIGGMTILVGTLVFSFLSPTAPVQTPVDRGDITVPDPAWYNPGTASDTKTTPAMTIWDTMTGALTVAADVLNFLFSDTFVAIVLIFILLWIASMVLPVIFPQDKRRSYSR